VRYFEIIQEAESRTLQAGPNITAAKRFVFQKWRERAGELGRGDPIDLSK
jgi:hypothetical protein